jgi:membrane protein YqaA with SNARE-associated domain
LSVLDWIWQTLLSVAFGAGSAVVPVLNAEAYIVGVGVSGVLQPVVAAVCVGVGQSLGKVGLFLAVRHRPGWAALHASKEFKPVDLTTRRGRWRHRSSQAAKRMLDAIGDSRYGVPVILLSAFVGFPPLYAVALISGASRMRVLVFALTVLVGRVSRFVLLIIGVSAF